MPNFKARLGRSVAITGSVILTLAMIIGLALLAGIAVVDNKLSAVGITDWSLSIGNLSRQRVVIEQLSVTMDEVPQATDATSGHSPPPLKKWLTTDIPSWLPDTIILKNVTLNGDVFKDYAPLNATFQFHAQRQEASLELLHPESIIVNLSRKDGKIRLNAKHQQGQLAIKYLVSSGAFNIESVANVPVSKLGPAVEFIKSDHVAFLLSADGFLSSEMRLTDPQAFLNAVSGKLTLSLRQPIRFTASDVASTVTKGKAQVHFNNGIIDSYNLAFGGELTQWPKLPLKLSTVEWQLSSQDAKTFDPFNYQAVISQSDWPIQLSATLGGQDLSNAQLEVNGQLTQTNAQFVRIKLPDTSLRVDSINLSRIDALRPLKLDSVRQLSINADIAVDHEQITIKSKQASLFASSQYADAALSISALAAQVPFAAPENAKGKLTTHTDNVAVKVAGFETLTPALSHEVRYDNGDVNAEGTIQLAQTATLKHQTRVSPALDFVSNIDININDLANAHFQQQVIPLLDQVLPLLTVSKGSAEAELLVSGNGTLKEWQVTKGHVNLTAVDAIYDTTAITSTTVNTEFNASPTQVRLKKVALSAASVQQGFTVGPASVGFSANLPLKDWQNSTVTLNEHSIKALGGTVRIPNQTYDLAESLHIPIVFERINLGELMRQYPTNRIAIDGHVSGTIPLHWDSQQLVVEDGYLSAMDPGGHLQVESSFLRSAVGSNPSLKTLASVLEDFYYQELSSVVGYDKNGELTLGLQLNGYNPAVENGRKVKLNITLEEDLPALIKGIQLSNSVSDVIRKRIQQRVD